MWGKGGPIACSGIGPAYLNVLDEGLILQINPNFLPPPNTPMVSHRVGNPIRFLRTATQCLGRCPCTLVRRAMTATEPKGHVLPLC